MSMGTGECPMVVHFYVAYTVCTYKRYKRIMWVGYMPIELSNMTHKESHIRDNQYVYGTAVTTL